MISVNYLPPVVAADGILVIDDNQDIRESLADRCFHLSLGRTGLHRRQRIRRLANLPAAVAKRCPGFTRHEHAGDERRIDI